MLQFSPFNLFVIVMITILIIFFIIFVIKILNPTSRSKKIKSHKKYKNFDLINILEDKIEENEDFVISKDEIHTFLAEVRNKPRISLLGVENIVLTSRPKQLSKVFSGA